MKLFQRDKYFRLCVYIALTVLFVFVTGLIIYNIAPLTSGFLKTLAYIAEVFMPLIIALIIALLFSPLVNLIEKYTGSYVKDGFIKRTKAVIITYVIIFSLIGILITIASYKLNTDSLEGLVEKTNLSLEGFADLFVLLKVKLAELGILENVDGYLESLVRTITEYLKMGVTNIGQVFSKAGGWLVNLAIGFTIAFYFLSDKDRIVFYCKKTIDVFFPKNIALVIKTFFGDVTSIFSGYIGGQITDAGILALLVTIAFTIIGIPYAPIVGILTGFSNLIPYVGAFTAFILSVVLGLMSGTPIKALYAAITVILLQQVDSLIIVPKVVGKSVSLNPCLVLLGLAVFGKLFGIVGMVVAVPITSLIKLYLVRLYEYMEKKQE